PCSTAPNRSSSASAQAGQASSRPARMERRRARKAVMEYPGNWPTDLASMRVPLRTVEGGVAALRDAKIRTGSSAAGRSEGLHPIVMSGLAPLGEAHACMAEAAIHDVGAVPGTGQPAGHHLLGRL